MGRTASLVGRALGGRRGSSLLAALGRLRTRVTGPSTTRLARQQPDGLVPFIVLTSHRTGSNLLVSLLADHPRVHATGEVLNRHVPLAVLCPEARERERLRPARLLHHRVFARPDVDAAGCKVFYHHGAGFSVQAWAYLSALDGLRVIHLRRRDRLARYVSYLRAMDDGVWMRGPGDDQHVAPPRVTVDPAGFRQHVEMWDGRRRAAEQRIAGRPTLDVWYEDLVADRAGTMERVFGHLDVAPMTVRSSLRRQRTSPLDEVVVDHDRVAEGVADVRWEPDAER